MLENNIITGFADEIDPMLDKQMEVLDKLGMSYIEMRGVDGKGLVYCSMEEVKDIKRRLTDKGIRLSSVGSPIGKIGIGDEFAPHMELLRHTVEIAHEMEVPYIRMFSFYI
ncbi:MAG: sugar phosphate isomerase/epimerase, partial [Acetatifactor sp.]